MRMRLAEGLPPAPRLAFYCACAEQRAFPSLFSLGWAIRANGLVCPACSGVSVLLVEYVAVPWGVCEAVASRLNQA